MTEALTQQILSSCGTGALTRSLLMYGANAFGLDVSQAAVDWPTSCLGLDLAQILFMFGIGFFQHSREVFADVP